MPEFPIAWVRDLFPALNAGDNFVFFDNGAGAQIPHIVLDAVHAHLVSHNVQRGGRYGKSQQVDLTIQRARESVATFLNAREPDEVAFGMNATSFIRLVSLAITEVQRGRPEIVVTDLDHEGNIAPWLALPSQTVEICWWKVRNDGRLHVADLVPLLSSRTRLVACTMASNAIGSIVDVKEVARMSHAVGAEVFLDAVQYAPHGPIDVQDLDCDYLVCSGYKIFAPHMGFFWGKRRALEALPTFREDFIPDKPPAKIEVGTFIYENVAGMDASISYLEQLGLRASSNRTSNQRRGALLGAMEAIQAYEALLSERLLRALSDIDGVTVYGIRDPGFTRARVPAVSFNVSGWAPSDIAGALAEKGIGVRDGHMYSPRLLQRLGISPETGAVRVSLAHYNTSEEIDYFIEELRRIARN